jgi:hypothetical protein
VANFTQYTDVHRKLWPSQRVYDECIKGSPVLGRLRRETDLGEDTRYIALQHVRPQGRSRAFATAQARAANGAQFKKFGIKTVDDYAAATWPGKMLRADKIDPAFIVDVFERESKGAMAQIARSLNINLWGTGSGARGRIASSGLVESGGNTTITLSDPADAKNFEIGMYINAAATATGATRDSGAAYEVIAVDLIAGTVQVSGTAQTTSSWSEASDPSDYLFAQGDANNNATLDGVPGPMLAGIPGWIPTTAPTSGDDWFGVDRSAHVQYLAGWRFTAAALSTTTIRATVLKSFSQMSRNGLYDAENRPETLVMNGEDYGDFLDELDGKYDVTERKAMDAELYYKGVRIQTPIGDVEVFQDFQCPRGRAYALNLNSWTLGSIGEAPFIVEEDGLRILRSGSADSYEARFAYHANLWCDAPVLNGVITLPT